MISEKSRDTSNPFYLQKANLFSQSMTAPPAESMPHVIQFELTEGCSYGACSFCDMPQGEYRVKSLREYKHHVDDVWDSFKAKSLLKFGKSEIDLRGIERLFIGGENALSVDRELFQDAMDYTIKKFKNNTSRLPRRITVYGNTRDILEKSHNVRVNREMVQALESLNCGGVCGDCSIGKFGQKIGLGYVYWGIESGDTDTLRYVNKGFTKEDLLKASNALDVSGIRKSVTIIPGLGGIKFADSHLEETVDVLNKVEPEFVTFIGINPAPHTRYAQKMAKEIEQGTNRPLTERELVEQTLNMFQGLDFETTAGCFGTEIQKFGRNPLPFGSIEVSRWNDNRENLVSKLRKKVNTLPD